jgi:hypothetical protein
VGNFPDRVENLHLVYAVLLRAVEKIAPLLENQLKCPDQATQNILKEVADTARLFALDETSLFQGPKGIELVDDVRSKFRNISRIMDCVSCQKCRLWGKTQVTGIGTALKILFGIDERLLSGYFSSKQPILSRLEIVALINSLNRFAESVHDVEAFTLEKNGKESKSESKSPVVDMPPRWKIFDDEYLPFWRFFAAVITLIPFGFAAFYTAFSGDCQECMGVAGSTDSLSRDDGYSSDSERAGTQDALGSPHKRSSVPLTLSEEEPDLEYSSSGIDSDDSGNYRSRVKRSPVYAGAKLSETMRKLQVDQGYDGSVEASEADPDNDVTELVESTRVPSSPIRRRTSTRRKARRSRS